MGAGNISAVAHALPEALAALLPPGGRAMNVALATGIRRRACAATSP